MTALWPYLIPPSSHGDDSICAVGATGHRVTFADGRTVLDADSGVWNVNIGYGNQRIAAAIAEAAEHASYLGAFRFENSYARRAAEDLLRVCGPDHYSRVLFSTGGGVANDAVMKLARIYHAVEGRPGRNLVVSLRGSFHGLTFGGFALTGEDLGQRVYGVDQRLIRHVTPNDTAELGRLMAALGNQVAAVIVEPVLGTGTLPLEESYIGELGRLRDEYGFLLVADEVATGFGRTGTYFASESWEGRPDVLVTSKGLTNGASPAAALVISHRVTDALVEHDTMFAHAETQGANAIACAAISATIAEMERLDAVTAGRNVAAWLQQGLSELVERHPLATRATGVGCFRTLHLVHPDGRPLAGTDVADLITRIRQAGAIVHPGPSGIQLVPSLTYSRDEVAELMTCIEEGLAGLSAPVASLAARS
ncbi:MULTISPECIES: daptide-type RiPP biosynthesis aminotransferase [Streptomyces]|uniref:daptide-type RiPP biosynthesis aminotransferase n=1 Tax=Streptomyces TaxID=1883 RepID=UPI000527DF46|nr:MULTISPECIES: daptide-type RiPP biosynthesis aminotransferase [Streptomyces]MCX5278237.1 aminotransferase class III-fold pyridoxal phosphate-dependent enzyme [Streptomyces virginiae]MYV79396.1 aminotransferase class III-fold pyridoxal phosphate-dependent enzyme [Streptomyces sp. SID1046]